MPSRRVRRRHRIVRSPMDPLHRAPLESYRPNGHVDTAAHAAAIRAPLHRSDHIGTLIAGWGLDTRALPLDAVTVEQAERLRRFRERVRELEQARQLADTLLTEFLSPTQVTDLRAHDAFEVTAQGGRRYLIMHARSGNILREPEPGRRMSARFCVHPRDYVPDMDTMLAQALYLQTDEDGFLALANEHPPMKPPRWWLHRLTTGEP